MIFAYLIYYTYMYLAYNKYWLYVAPSGCICTVLVVYRVVAVCYNPSLPQEHVTVAEDMRICTVKLADEMERRFCFEVVTPRKSAMLQADSEGLRKKWLTYLEAGIARALRISASNKVSLHMHVTCNMHVICLCDVVNCMHLTYKYLRPAYTRQQLLTMTTSNCCRQQIA